MTGLPLIIAFVLAIVVMIVAISKFKLHPFLAIMGVSLVLALIAGIPLTGIADVIGAGFSGTFSSIGIVIILGALIGSILEVTGAALKLADIVIKLVGKKALLYNARLCLCNSECVITLKQFIQSRSYLLSHILCIA